MDTTAKSDGSWDNNLLWLVAKRWNHHGNNKNITFANHLLTGVPAPQQYYVLFLLGNLLVTWAI